MHRVVILAINARYSHSSLAAWILSESVSRFARRKHEAVVIEMNINQACTEIADAVAARKPDAAAIPTYIWNAGKLPEIISLLRERLPEAAIILGGPEAAHNAEYWANNGADYVIKGEGERSFPALLDALHAHKPCDAILEPVPADCYINPYTEHFLHELNNRIAYIETSRGCPFSCSFCLSGGTGVSFFPIDMVKERIRLLAESNARTVKFVDRTFNCDAERAYELFEFIIQLDTTRCFHFEVAADLFNARTIELLKTAPSGRIQLEAGLQSFNQKTLDACARKTDLDKACYNIRELLRNNNIHIHVDLIAGLPHEVFSEITDGFNRAFALKAHTLQLGFLKLLHGSEMRRNEGQIKHSEQPPYEIISSPWLSEQDIRALKQAENALQHTYNKGRFLGLLSYVLSTGITPFELFRSLGVQAPNNGQSLAIYSEQLYNSCLALPNIEQDKLRDALKLDLLAMVLCNDMPRFLKTPADRRMRKAAAVAERMLNRRIRRHEVVILSTGEAYAGDAFSRDPVTGLYRLLAVPPEW